MNNQEIWQFVHESKVALFEVCFENFTGVEGNFETYLDHLKLERCY